MDRERGSDTWIGRQRADLVVALFAGVFAGKVMIGRMAITRAPGPELSECLLTYVDRLPIDTDLAVAQHQAYEKLLQEFGYECRSLAADRRFPDGVFVEDVAVVLDEIAIITAPNPVSRQGEWPSVEVELRNCRPIRHLPRQVTLEGGDVLRIGRNLLVGISTRTDVRGYAAFDQIVAEYGYRTRAIKVHGGLHLKTVCTALDDQSLLVDPRGINLSELAPWRTVTVPDDEPWGANVMRLDQEIVVSSAASATAAMLERMSYRVRMLDISELQKAEAGLTCLSLLCESQFRAGSSDDLHSRA